jgi:hypothetical protein
MTPDLAIAEFRAKVNASIDARGRRRGGVHISRSAALAILQLLDRGSA